MRDSITPSRRPSILWSDNSRRFTSFAAVAWILVGILVSISRWSTVEQTSRTFVMSILFLALLAGVGAAVFAFRGTRRNTMLFLAAASFYPAIIWPVLGWVPLALLLYLFFDSMRIASRDNLRSKKVIWIVGSMVVIFLVGSTWYQIHFDSATSLESQRVQRAFQKMTASISKKEGGSTSWLTPVYAGTSNYTDGSKATLWIPKPSPMGERSNCFYIDNPKKKTGYGYIYLDCNRPKEMVILQRQHAIVVGFLNEAKVKVVHITAEGTTATVPVTLGYFIMPSALSAFPLAKFTIRYSDPDQATCKVSDLSAPGSASSGVCTIA